MGEPYAAIKIVLPKKHWDSLAQGLWDLTEAIDKSGKAEAAQGFLGGEFGYGALFENEVFSMRPDYADAECDCGASAAGEMWHKDHPHSQSCFRTVLHGRFAEYDEQSGYNAIDAATRAPGNAHDEQQKAHRKLTAELYEEMGLPKSPYQWHCTCGVDEQAKTFFAGPGKHKPTCALELPNFRYKAGGLEARWYKYIGRGMEAVGEGDWNAAIAHCIASVSPQH